MTTKIEKAKKAIENCGVMEKLAAYSSEVVSTIFVGFDIEGSDIDIVCCYRDAEQFAADFEDAFGSEAAYQFSVKDNHQVGRFKRDGFLFEIYASTIPVIAQMGYRHFQVMKRLSALGGEEFRASIRKLKTQGHKTEPAIAKALKLTGDPYEAVLEIEKWSDKHVVKLLKKM